MSRSRAMFCVTCRRKLAFDGVVLVQQRGEPRDFVFAQLAGLGLRIDAGLVAQLAGDLRADAVQVRQRDDRRLIVAECRHPSKRGID